MKHIKTTVLFAILFVCCINVCSQSLPSTAMGIPKIFLKEELSFSWEDIAARREWGELTNNPWKVYIDHEGVKAYSQSNSSSSVKHTCDFMEAYYVAMIENGYALLFSQQIPSLTISSNAKVCGWVSVDDILLWSTCPRTKNQVYKKALIVKDMESDDIDASKESSPKFSKSPTSVVPNGFRATQLEIFFVFKETSKSALMFRGRKIDDNMLTKHHGWMRRSEFTSWNERICFEKNFGDDVVGSFAAIYDTKDKAGIFKEVGIGDMTVVWKEKLELKRSDPRIVRFPILDIDSRYIAQVATISQFTAEGGKSISSSELLTFQKKLDDIDDKIGTINVVFVVDATSSMKDYYKSMAEAIIRSMKYDEMSKKKINFGAVVYRNYADANGGSFKLLEKKELTRDYNSVAEWLSGRQCGSAELVDSYEAMYYGLDQAADMFKDKTTCNFIVLVGDAGNREPDAKGLTVSSVASKLASKEINFVAFQVNSNDKPAYLNFAQQVGQIMVQELSLIDKKKITRSDFKTQGYLKEYLGDNKWPLISAGYKFVETGRSESPSNLEALIEKKITDFVSLAMKNKADFQKEIDKLMSGDGPVGTQVTEDIIRRLEERGISRSTIEAMRKAGAAIKLKGYTTRTSAHKEVFTTSVFMTKTELDMLIRSLESLNSNSGENQRLELQKALKNLALIYIGQIKDDMEIDDLLDAVNGLGRATGGKSPLAGISIKNIINPNQVSQRLIDDFIKRIQVDVRKLRTLENDKSCYFTFNNERYYYILLEDMPLQSE